MFTTELRSLKLQDELENLLGTTNVYFQPGPDVLLDYPCFVYNRVSAFQPKANDYTYLFRPAYEVTYINRDEPDPDILPMIAEHFHNCRYDRHFVTENLHHDVFTIYY